MLDIRKLITPAVFAYPQFQTIDGVKQKLSHFEITDDGVVPVYVETDEIGDSEALDIILGVSE